MNFFSTLAATLIGVAATWFFAWWYYRRAGDELGRESAELRRITTLILTALEGAGLAEVKWDHSGSPLGINLTLRAGTPPTVRFEVPAATVVTTDPK